MSYRVCNKDVFYLITYPGYLLFSVLSISLTFYYHDPLQKSSICAYLFSIYFVVFICNFIYHYLAIPKPFTFLLISTFPSYP